MPQKTFSVTEPYFENDIQIYKANCMENHGNPQSQADTKCSINERRAEIPVLPTFEHALECRYKFFDIFYHRPDVNCTKSSYC